MIEINNLTRTAVNKKFLKTLAQKVLEGENRRKSYLSIAFVGEDRMRKINKQYRGQDKPTDVLSFKDDLGEIIICPSQVKKNTRKYNKSFKKELSCVLIHGILHLLSYEHGSKMEKKQEYYLNLFKY